MFKKTEKVLNIIILIDTFDFIIFFKIFVYLTLYYIGAFQVSVIDVSLIPDI